MRAGLMPTSSRAIIPASLLRRARVLPSVAPTACNFQPINRSSTHARARGTSLSKTWFTSIPPLSHPEPGAQDHEPPNERLLKLGKTIRVLHERLPTLLASPLPAEILSPQITLHLFPSTHPHLPTVSGRIAYTAALWTAPVAWGRVPVVGNVKLTIISERMVKNGGGVEGANGGKEKLIVKWKTCSTTEGKQKTLDEGANTSETVQKMAKIVKDLTRLEDEFVGLFIFEFDEEGRVVTHIIEHAEEGGSWDRTARVISVTDWLLGRAWGKRSEDGSPGLALAQARSSRRAVDRK